MQQTYRSRPMQIEAVLWDGLPGTLEFLVEWSNGAVSPSMISGHFVLVETPEGVMKGRVGDYIIKGTIGEFYPCKPEVFEAKYEVVVL